MLPKQTMQATAPPPGQQSATPALDAMQPTQTSRETFHEYLPSRDIKYHPAMKAPENGAEVLPSKVPDPAGPFPEGPMAAAPAPMMPTPGMNTPMMTNSPRFSSPPPGAPAYPTQSFGPPPPPPPPGVAYGPPNSPRQSFGSRPPSPTQSFGPPMMTPMMTNAPRFPPPPSAPAYPTQPFAAPRSPPSSPRGSFLAPPPGSGNLGFVPPSSPISGALPQSGVKWVGAPPGSMTPRVFDRVNEMPPTTKPLSPYAPFTAYDPKAGVRPGFTLNPFTKGGMKWNDVSTGRLLMDEYIDARPPHVKYGTIPLPPAPPPPPTHVLKEKPENMKKKKAGQIPIPVAVACVLLPLILYTLTYCVLGYSLRYHAPIVAYIITGLIFLAVVGVGAAAFTADNWTDRFWLGLLFGLSFLGAFAGTLMGNSSYINWLQPFNALQQLNVYENVNPSSAHGNQYMDFGILNFVPSASIDAGLTGAFKNHDVYCAAPITTGSSQSSYEFWAVGTNCCQSGFQCGDWKTPLPHSGLRITDEATREWYELAARQAASKYGITVHQPVFFSWVVAPTEQIEALPGFAAYRYLKGLLLGLGLVMAITILSCLPWLKHWA